MFARDGVPNDEPWPHRRKTFAIDIPSAPSGEYTSQTWWDFFRPGAGEVGIAAGQLSARGRHHHRCTTRSPLRRPTQPVAFDGPFASLRSILRTPYHPRPKSNKVKASAPIPESGPPAPPLPYGSPPRKRVP